MMRLCLALGVSMCALASAQSPPRVEHVGGPVSAPVLISKQEPVYSDEARIAKLQGSVLLALEIGEDGNPQNVQVRRSLGLGLDEAAIAAVKSWRFKPGMKEGHPVTVASIIEVNFRLLTGKDEWRLQRVAYNLPQGASQPAIVHAPYPRASGPEVNAFVTVSFDINERGSPTNIHVDNSTDPQWDDEVTALIREWRFLAAFKDGIPVAAHVLVDFGRGEFTGPRPVAAPKKLF